jgi:hypothetical protein
MDGQFLDLRNDAPRFDLVSDMDRAAADDRSAARAGAQFRQCHPYRHAVPLSFAVAVPNRGDACA